MTVLKIAAALLMLGVLILSHELGHFFAARKMGVRVNEFAIGMGPKLLHWGKGETLYTLRAFPIGGFCAMEGEDEGVTTPEALGGNGGRTADADPERSFGRKKVWQRFIILSAGALMNLLVGYVLLVGYYAFLQPPYDDSGTVLLPTTTIASLSETTPAYAGGLRAGDTILSVNGRRIFMDTDLTMEMQSDTDGVLSMVVRRTVDGKRQKVRLDAVAFELAEDEASGRRYLRYDFSVLGKVRTPLNVFSEAAKQELSVATVVWRSLVDLIRGRFGVNELSGPVGTVDIIADAVGNAHSVIGWQSLVMLMVLITVNLGVFNLLPLPALDGGRLLFLVWEGITHKPVPAKYEGMIHFAGLVLLMMLMLFITYSDITRLFT